MKTSMEMRMIIEREISATYELVAAKRKLNKIKTMKEKLINRENVALIKNNLKNGVDCSDIRISTKNALQLFIDEKIKKKYHAIL